jgi:hypothetical protein
VGFLDFLKPTPMPQPPRRASPNKEPTPLSAVRTAFKAVAATFVEERVRRFPDSEPMFRLAKGYLVLGHHACEMAINDLFTTGDTQTQRSWEPYANALLASPFRNMQILFCLQQLQLANSLFADKADFSADWASLMAEGACDLYSQPWSIVQELMRRVAERPEADRTKRFMNCANEMQQELIGYENRGGYTFITDMMLRDTVFRIFVEMAKVGKDDKEQIVRLSDLLLAKM